MEEQRLNPNEYYERLVIENPKAISTIPSSMITDKMLKQVAISGYISYIPKSLITSEHVILYIKNNKGTFYFSNISEMILAEPEVQKVMLEYCPGKMYKIPSALINKKYLKEALAVAGTELYRYLSNSLKTKEISVFSFKNNRNVFKFIPDKHKDEDMCVEAVLYDPKNLSFVPKNILTPKFAQRIKLSGVELPQLFEEYINSLLKDNGSGKVILGSSSDPESDLKEHLISDFPLYFGSRRLNKYHLVTLYDLKVFLDSEFSPNGEKISTYDYNELRSLSNAFSILRCRIFGEDPGIHLETEGLSIEEGTIQFGLTNKTSNAIQRACVLNETKTFDELIQCLFYPNRLYERKFYFTNTSTPYKELQEKYFVVKNFYESKNKDSDGKNIIDIDLKIESIKKQMSELQTELTRLQSIKANQVISSLRRGRVKEKGIENDDK